MIERKTKTPGPSALPVETRDKVRSMRQRQDWDAHKTHVRVDRMVV